MSNKYFQIFLIVICGLSVISPALVYAEGEVVEEIRVYYDYSPVRTLHTFGLADADLEASKVGLKGDYKVMPASAIPSDRTDRNAWKFSKGQIVVDPAIKSELQSEREKKTASVQKLKDLGLTEEDLKNLNIGGV